MRTTGRARRGTRATTACRWRQRVVPRDAGHRGQRVLSRLSGRERGNFASRLAQFAITRIAVPRRANGPDSEPPLGVHEQESSGDRRKHPLCRCRFGVSGGKRVVRFAQRPCEQGVLERPHRPNPVQTCDLGGATRQSHRREMTNSTKLVQPSARVARRRPGERRRARRRSGLADEEKNFSCRSCTRRPMGHPPGPTTCTAVRGGPPVHEKGVSPQRTTKRQGKEISLLATLNV